MKIIFKGKRVNTVVVEELSLDEIKAFLKMGKEVYIADGNLIIEEGGKDE